MLAHRPASPGFQKLSSALETDYRSISEDELMKPSEAIEKLARELSGYKFPPLPPPSPITDYQVIIIIMRFLFDNDLTIKSIK